MKEGGEGGGGGFVRADQIDLKSLDEQLERHLSKARTMEKKRKGEEGDGVKVREEWEIDPAKLLIKGLIARGTFGSVHRGVYDGQDVAVKLLDWGEEGSRTEAEIVSLRAAFTQEVSVWHKLDHPNVTKFIGATLGAADLNIQTESGQIGMPTNVCCVVVEYLPGGALKTYLIKNHRRKLAFKIVVQLALDLARGLSYLHSKKIVHRDVKTENMLLDRTRTLKIADFGVARVEAQNPHDMTGETGNLGYMAPEVLNGNPYSRKCDVYSFGICLWEIYCCDMPYADLTFSEVTSTVVQQNLRPEIPRCCPNSLANVMKRCWDASPNLRPEMDEVVALLEAIDTSKGGGTILLDQQQGCMPFFHSPDLWRDKHIEFLKRGFNQLGLTYCVLDANRPWLCYWILHSMALLGESLDTELENNTVDFLSLCEDRNGGYGGGPGQMPHLATTYAAVNTLVTLGSDAALLSINRDALHKFLLRMKDSSGAFRMHLAGEIDVRACYTAISVASMLNILDFELANGVGDYILSCQTYEGGIAGEPGSEAHGGYTFCGLATMILINEVDRLDLPSLIDWVAFRQGVERGFDGRTNKLVDGCYSFWQGGSLSLIQRLPCFAKNQIKSSLIGMRQLPVEGGASSAAFSGRKPNRCLCQVHDHHNSDAGRGCDTGLEFIRTINGVPLFHSIALQQYILLCSQVLEGGFRDKPGKLRDHYHTCYCLSGLSVSQYSFSKTADSPPLPNAVLGPYSNLLEPVHPLYNVVLDQYYRALEFFSLMR